MSDNESDINSNISRDSEEWVIVNQQNASDSDINDEELINVTDESEGQQQDRDPVIDDSPSLNLADGQLFQEPSCSIDQDPSSVHTSVSDCSVIFVKNHENFDQGIHVDVSLQHDRTAARAVDSVSYSSNEEIEESEFDSEMHQDPSFTIFGFHLGLKDSNERIFVFLIFLMIFAFLVITMKDGYGIFKNPSDNVATTSNILDCKSNLHEKLRELASCKLTKDFCQPTEKPSCFSTKQERNMTREYERRLDGMKNNVKRLVEGRGHLEMELEFLRANLTAIQSAYDNLQVTKIVESDWLRRTNNFLTRQLRRASKRVVETRHKAHVSKNLLFEMRKKLDNLEKTIRDLKGKGYRSKQSQKVTRNTCNNQNIFEYFDNLRRDINVRPSIVDLMSFYATDFVKKLEPKQKLDDLAYLTVKIFNDSLTNLNVIYERVVENSAENLKTIKKSIWNESCSTFNAIYFKLKNSSELAAVFDTVHANLGHLWSKSNDFVFEPQTEEDLTVEVESPNKDNKKFDILRYPKIFFKLADKIFDGDRKETKATDSDDDSLLMSDRVMPEKPEIEEHLSSVQKNVADFDDESDLQHPVTSDTDNLIIVDRSTKVDRNSELSRFIDALKKSSIKYHLGKMEYVDYLNDLDRSYYLSAEDRKPPDYFWPCQKNWWLGYGRYLHQSQRMISSRKYDCSRYLYDWQISEENFVCDQIFDDEGDICQDDRRRQILRESAYLNEILHNFDRKSWKWMSDRSKLRQESRRSAGKDDSNWWFERMQGRREDRRKVGRDDQFFAV